MATVQRTRRTLHRQLHPTEPKLIADAQMRLGLKPPIVHIRSMTRTKIFDHPSIIMKPKRRVQT
jgi:hypothetical protein